MYARNFADALRFYGSRLAKGVLDYAGNALGRSARRVELVDVVDFLDTRLVSVALEYLAGPAYGSEEGIYTYREIGCPDKDAACLTEGLIDFILDVIPSCSADDNGLETHCKCLIIGPERIRGGKIYANALFRNIFRNGTNVLRSTNGLYARSQKNLFHHMAHLAISADYNLHKFSKIFT